MLVLCGPFSLPYSACPRLCAMHHVELEALRTRLLWQPSSLESVD